MESSFINSWGDSERAASYSGLEFPNTYWLAYRDLPQIISKHVRGSKAVDFGCGTGRSSRFLKDLGFDVTGIDISEDMIAQAAKLDPKGVYMKVTDCNYAHLGIHSFDLVQSIFTFDNIPGWDNRISILNSLSELLTEGGKMLLLDSTPELYTVECASFSTKQFPGNRTAKTGDKVYCIMHDVPDKRPVEDIFWSVEDYHELFRKANLKLIDTYKPLGHIDEPFAWVSETSIAPWMIFVLETNMR